MKRIIFALVLIAALATSMFASAATLPLNGGTVQGGTDVTVSCQAEPVYVSSWVVDDAIGEQGKVAAVRINGVQDSCNGNRMFVTVITTGGREYRTAERSDSSGALSRATFASINSDQNASIYGYQMGIVTNWGDTDVTRIPAEEIAGVRIVIEGGTAANQ